MVVYYSILCAKWRQFEGKLSTILKYDRKFCLYGLINTVSTFIYTAATSVDKHVIMFSLKFIVQFLGYK